MDMKTYRKRLLKNLQTFLSTKYSVFFATWQEKQFDKFVSCTFDLEVTHRLFFNRSWTNILTLYFPAFYINREGVQKYIFCW